MRYKRAVQEFAYDAAIDQAVHASEVLRVEGKRYQCYCTNGPHAVFVRKPKKRRAHFAHLADVVVRSDPNREVHDWTRDTLYRLIGARLGDPRPLLQVKWRCKECGFSHQRNLLESIVACYRERFTDKKAMRPDLSLHGVADDLRRVIEVVNQNPPNADKLVYYRMEMMTLIVVRGVKNWNELFVDGVLWADVATYRCERVAA